MRAVPGLPQPRGQQFIYALDGPATEVDVLAELGSVPTDQVIDLYINLGPNAVVSSSKDWNGGFLGDSTGHAMYIGPLFGGSRIFFTNKGLVQTHGGRGGFGAGGDRGGTAGNFGGGGGGGGGGFNLAAGWHRSSGWN